MWSLDGFSVLCRLLSVRRRFLSGLGFERDRLPVEVLGLPLSIPVILLTHCSHVTYTDASPEIRHIAGKHIREFRDFLERHPDVFIMQDESVFLRDNGSLGMKPFKELEEPKCKYNIEGYPCGWTVDFFNNVPFNSKTGTTVGDNFKTFWASNPRTTKETCFKGTLNFPTEEELGVRKVKGI